MWLDGTYNVLEDNPGKKANPALRVNPGYNE
jgi:hypothetical protein